MAVIESERALSFYSAGTCDSVSIPAVLIVEADVSFCSQLQQLISSEHCAPHIVEPERDIFQILRITSPDMVIVGSVEGSDEASLELARGIRRHNPNAALILLVTNGSETLAIAALRAGVSDYIRRSEWRTELPKSLVRILSRKSSFESQPPKPEFNTGACDSILLGDSEVVSSIRRQIGRLGETDSNLLITGETGTGKGIVAELVHRNSGRRDKPFLCVNCAAIPEGLLESELFGHEKGAFTGAYKRYEGILKAATGGTVLLDEIGDMGTFTQAKILHAIERKEVQRVGSSQRFPIDVRIIAATNRDLEQLVTEDQFREDLYFRLDVARVDILPLRERKEDLVPLCLHFLGELNHRFETCVEG